MTTDKQARKERPMATGLLHYFPDALAEVANVSFVGNQQHNPGEPLHWARNKSTDHADCIVRHLTEQGKMDDDGMRHSAKLAWRALALLQLEIEHANSFVAEKPKKTEPVIGSEVKELNDWLIAKDEARHQRFVALGKEPEIPSEAFGFEDFLAFGFDDRMDDDEDDIEAGVFFSVDAEPHSTAEFADQCFLISKGCDPEIVKYITGGTTYQNDDLAPYVYISGPMRGKPEFNFPEFDKMRDTYAANGYNVVSPADIDRAGGLSEGDQSVYVYRDFYALLLIAHRKGYIHMMAGHERSTGATAELALAKWLGIATQGVGQ